MISPIITELKNKQKNWIRASVQLALPQTNRLFLPSLKMGLKNEALECLGMVEPNECQGRMFILNSLTGSRNLKHRNLFLHSYLKWEALSPCNNRQEPKQGSSFLPVGSPFLSQLPTDGLLSVSHPTAIPPLHPDPWPWCRLLPSLLTGWCSCSLTIVSKGWGQQGFRYLWNCTLFLPLN